MEQAIHNVKMVYDLKWIDNDKIVSLIPQKTINKEKKKYKAREKTTPAKPLYQLAEKYITKMYKNYLIDYYNLDKNLRLSLYTTNKTEQVYKFILERTIKINKSCFTFLQPKDFLKGFSYGHETFTSPLNISDTGLTNALKILEENELIITHKFGKDRETLYVLNIEKGRELIHYIKQGLLSKKDCQQFQRVINEKIKNIYTIDFLEDKNYRFCKNENDNLNGNDFGDNTNLIGNKAKRIGINTKLFGNKSKLIGQNESENSSNNKGFDKPLPRIIPINNLEKNKQEQSESSKQNNLLSEVKGDVVVFENFENENKENIDTVLQELGFSLKEIKELREKNDDETIISCIDSGKRAFKNGSIKNLEGWVKSCLKNGYKINKKETNQVKEKTDLSIYSDLFRYFKIDKNSDTHIIEQRLSFKVLEFIKEVSEIKKDIDYRVKKRIEVFKNLPPVLKRSRLEMMGIYEIEEKYWFDHILKYEKSYEQKIIESIKEFKVNVDLNVFSSYLDFIKVESKETIDFIKSIEV